MKHPNRSLWYLAHQQVIASRPVQPEPKYRSSMCMGIADFTCEDCPALESCRCPCHGDRITTPA